MNTTPSPEGIEPNNAVVAAADERLKHAYQQIASADEQLARVTEQLSRLENNSAHRSSAAPALRPSHREPALRGFIGLLLAACIAGAAFVSQSSSGDATRVMIARWLPPALASSLPVEKPVLHAAPGAIQVAAAEVTALPASPPAPVTPQDVTPAPAPLSPELMQQLQTITQDIADLEQKIEQLKTTQEQVASDNAKAIDELKANQEEMTRLMAKASEPNARPKTSSISSVATARPVAITPRQSTPTHASPQARSLPSAAARSAPQQQ